MRDFRSPEAIAYRKLYKLATWCAVPHGLRWRVLVRDLFTCKLCGFTTTETSKLVADHIKPHKGDHALFFDDSNVRCLCKTCHDSAKQKEERLGYSLGNDLTGRPTSFNHPWNGGSGFDTREGLGPMSHPVWFRKVYVPLTIVCGAPASGKSTYVENNKGQSDIVFDLDEIAVRMFGKRVALLGSDRILDCLRSRNDALSKLMRASARHIAPHAWLIVAEPNGIKRQWWADTLEPQKIIVLETPIKECFIRAAKDGLADKKRGNRPRASIEAWWARYTRRDSDTVIL